MRKRFCLFILSLALFSLLFATFAHAQPTFVDSLGDIFAKEVAWPPVGGNQTNVPVYIIILVFALLASIMYAATHNVPLLKNSPSRNAVMIIAMAIAGIAVTGSRFVGDVWGLVGFAGNSAIWLGFILLIVFFIAVGFRGASAGIGILPQGLKNAAAAGGRNVWNPIGKKVARKIEGNDARIEREMKEESQIFQEIDKDAVNAQRDLIQLETYIRSMINILINMQKYDWQTILNGVSSRISGINDALRNARHFLAPIQKLDQELENLINDEEKKLKQDLQTTYTAYRASVSKPAQHMHIIQLSNRAKQVAISARTLKTSVFQISTIERTIESRLGIGPAGGGAKEFLRRGLAALAVTSTPNPQKARVAIAEFRSALAEIGIAITELSTVEKDAESLRNKIRTEFGSMTAMDHIAAVPDAL